MRQAFLAIAAMMAWSSAASAQITITPPLPPPSSSQADDAEVTRIFVSDQADRDTAQIDWAVVGPRDKARREAMITLMNKGSLVTGKDYEHASFVFQHGDHPDDYLLAHVLAATAVERGDRDAIWISAATLDRFLQAIARKQIFGTQFSTTRPPEPRVTSQEPYDRALVSDTIRRANRVMSETEQEIARRKIEGELK